jgi:hypothetical protein
MLVRGSFELGCVLLLIGGEMVMPSQVRAT